MYYFLQTPVGCCGITVSTQTVSQDAFVKNPCISQAVVNSVNPCISQTVVSTSSIQTVTDESSTQTVTPVEKCSQQGISQAVS